jgi:hypothetical protein
LQLENENKPTGEVRKFKYNMHKKNKIKGKYCYGEIIHKFKIRNFARDEQ